MIEYKIGNDLKLRLAFVIEGVRVSPDLVPFDIKLWTLYPSQAKYASYDGTQWVNCIMIDDYLEVNINAPQFTSGRLNCDVTLHYPDNEMGDLAYDKIIAVRFDNPLVNPNVQGVIITGEISDTITGLDAYAIAVQEGFGGTRQQWLDSLKKASEDAAEMANEAIAEFAAAEAARQSQESRDKPKNKKESAENLRDTAEQGRYSAENLRNSAELLRNSNESSRNSAFNRTTAFNNAETARANAFNTAEGLREDAEDLRHNAEGIRQNQEATRHSQEGNKTKSRRNKTNQRNRKTIC